MIAPLHPAWRHECEQSCLAKGLAEAAEQGGIARQRALCVQQGTSTTSNATGHGGGIRPNDGSAGGYCYPLGTGTVLSPTIGKGGGVIEQQAMLAGQWDSTGRVCTQRRAVRVTVQRVSARSGSMRDAGLMSDMA